MTARRQTNLLWGLVALAVAALLLLRVFDIVPEGLYDALGRAWPALMIFAGLMLLLPGRVPLGSVISLGVSIVLVVGIALTAYSSRAGQQRDDQQVMINQPVSASTNLLTINLNTLGTDVELINTGASSIGGEFAGSMESEITLDYDEGSDGRAEFTLTEARPDRFPKLDAVGRGALRLEIPQGVAVAVAINGDDGLMTFNLSDLLLERLSLEVQRGDVVITLPDYEPRSPTVQEEPGTLVVRDGDITVIVPATVSMRMELNRGGNDTRPEFDPSYILIDDGADGTLEKRVVGNDETQLFYEVTAPRGLIRLEVGGG